MHDALRRSTSALVLILVTGLLTGCAKQSVYLQNTRIDGPLSEVPLFVVGEEKEAVGSWRLSVAGSVIPDQRIEGRAEGHTRVNAAGVYQVDTVFTNGRVRYIEPNGVNTRQFEGTNFRWNLASFTGSVWADYRAARSLSIVGGLHYSRGGSQSYLGGTLGVGFSFPGENIGVRIDLGGTWTVVSYDIEYVVTTTLYDFGPPETYVEFFHDRGKAGNGTLYGALTLNSRYPTWPVQLYVQLAIYRQTVADVQRVAFSNITATVLQHNSFFAITPGLAVPLSSSSRLLLGLRMIDETALLVGEPGVLLAPFAQIEFTL